MRHANALDRRRFLTSAAAATGLTLTVGMSVPKNTHAQSSTRHTLNVMVFPGGFNWPLWVAQDRGLFAEQGLDVEIQNTPNSVTQMAALMSGQIDIAMTAIDNVIAYNEGQGESESRENADLVAISGTDGGFLRLVAAPGITSVADLRGKRVGVDALTTGYAFVLRDMLARAGIKETEVEWIRAGGVMQRFGSLQKGEIDATLLVTPFDRMVAPRGYKLLATPADTVGQYQGVVAAVRRPWAQQQRADVTGFATALRSAMRWLLSPGNRSQAEAILASRMPKMSGEEVSKLAQALLEAKDGFRPDAGIDIDGVRAALQLRERFTGPLARPTPASHIDLSYLAGK